MMKHKLGKLAAKKHAPRLWLSKYLNRSTVKIDSAPNLDYGKIVTDAFPIGMSLMLANGPDPANPPQIPGGVGDCFWAGETRDALIRLAQAGFPFPPSFTAHSLTMTALNGYSACTGFTLANPQATDNGTDANAGMQWIHQNGLLLPDGSVHKVGVPVWLNPQDFEELVIGSNLFGGLGCGFEFVASWEDSEVWDATNDPVVGGHWVPAFSTLQVTPNGIEVDSWGMTKIVTPAAFATKCDEVCVRIAPDFFGPDGKSVQGFDAEQLASDQAALAGGA